MDFREYLDNLLNDIKYVCTKIGGFPSNVIWALLNREYFEFLFTWTMILLQLPSEVSKMLFSINYQHCQSILFDLMLTKCCFLLRWTRPRCCECGGGCYYHFFYVSREQIYLNVSTFLAWRANRIIKTSNWQIFPRSSISFHFKRHNLKYLSFCAWKNSSNSFH